MICKLLFLLLASIICFGKQIQSNEQVKVQVYYECLCGGCVQFYQNDLYSLMKKLGPSSVNLLTYPFGNAMFSDEAHTQVKCQHGEDECYGNKLHACAIDLLKDTMKYVEFNTCLMGKGSNDDAADQCGQSQKIDPKPIKDCAKSKKGQDLLIYYGKETYKQRPAQGYTPYVLINGEEADDEKDFLDDVCSHFKKAPPACRRN